MTYVLLYLGGAFIARLVIPGDSNVITPKGRVVLSLAWPLAAVEAVAAWVEEKRSAPPPPAEDTQETEC